MYSAFEWIFLDLWCYIIVPLLIIIMVTNFKISDIDLILIRIRDKYYKFIVIVKCDRCKIIKVLISVIGHMVTFNPMFEIWPLKQGPASKIACADSDC